MDLDEQLKNYLFKNAATFNMKRTISLLFLPPIRKQCECFSFLVWEKIKLKMCEISKQIGTGNRLQSHSTLVACYRCFNTSIQFRFQIFDLKNIDHFRFLSSALVGLSKFLKRKKMFSIINYVERMNQTCPLLSSKSFSLFAVHSFLET
ncbi:Signal recognition particle protein [Sarcoptes scabiei]|nr:Signal recognition particle protein [Sarcoptes scabiei]